MIKPKLAAEATGPIGNLDPATTNQALLLVGRKKSSIQWPTDLEIEEVSTSLARIVQVGICSEANGEYFKSGDLAYQIQEIIRATAELCRKSDR